MHIILKDNNVYDVIRKITNEPEFLEFGNFVMHRRKEDESISGEKWEYFWLSTQYESSNDAIYAICRKFFKTTNRNGYHRIGIALSTNNDSMERLFKKSRNESSQKLFTTNIVWEKWETWDFLKNKTY